MGFDMAKLAIEGGKPSSEKYVPYGSQWLGEEDIQAVVSVLKGDWITQGPAIETFEKDVCAYTGARNAVAVANGTAALHLSVLAAGIRPGDEVIVTPYTFAASANAILYAGAKPVFADIDYASFNISPGQIKKKTTPKTKAIIPVHFAGLPCEMDEINEIAESKDLAVIEDAAHAIGAEYKGRKVGCGGTATFSFHPVKAITTGEGGMVVTSDNEMAQKIRALRTHGITKDARQRSLPAAGWYNAMEHLGFNYRITDFQAALGSSQLSRLDSFIRRRNEIAKTYADGLSGIPGLVLPENQPSKRSAWHIYCIRLKTGKWTASRDEVFAALRAENIGVNVHYLPVYLHPYYQRLGYTEGLCPSAEKAFLEEITLPLFPKMTDRQVESVIEAVGKVAAEYSK